MKAVHAEMGITPSDFQAIATHLDDALAEFDVGDDDREAVLEEIASYQGAIVTAAD